MHQQRDKCKVSITGDLGSGKSTVCNIIKEKYGFQVYSIGSIQRALAQKMNMTTLELNKYMEAHLEMEDQIDGELIEIAKKDENMLLDSRMAWHFVPESFKVYLTIDLNIAVERILSAERGKVEKYGSFEEARNKIYERKTSENFRFLKKYGVDCYNMENFDLIIDTSFAKPEEMVLVVKVFMKQLALWSGGKPYVKFWLPPKMLLPTQSAEACGEKGGPGEEEATEVIKVDHLYYIRGDHAKIAEALKNGIPLVPVKIGAEDEDLLPGGNSAREYANSTCNMDRLHAWEEKFGFTFLRYPCL